MDAEPNGRQAEEMADLTFELLEQCQIKRERIAEQHNLTVAEFKCLRVFKNDTMLHASEVAERMALSSSRLTRILDGLVEKQMVRRDLGSKDRRTMEVRLTQAGKKIQAEINKTYVQTHQDILDLLPRGAGGSVVLALEKLRDAMKQWVKA